MKRATRTDIPTSKPDDVKPLHAREVVALIRSCGTHETKRARELLETLSASVQRFCRRHISADIPPAAAEEIIESVQHSVRSDILRGNSSHLETAFWTVVKHDLLDEIDRVRRRHKMLSRYGRNRTAEAERTPLFDEAQQVESLAVRDALRTLEPRAYHALYVHYVVGIEISSIDPSVGTVSSLLGCSDKSARRLIKDAEKALRASFGRRAVTGFIPLVRCHEHEGEADEDTR